MRLRAVLVCAAALFLLTPAGAAATSFTVNDGGDGPDAMADGLCLTAAGACTLRAAIEESNRSSLDADQIGFAPSLPDTLTAGSTLAVSSPMTIDGCSADPNHAGPCKALSVNAEASVSPPPGMLVAANDVTVAGLALLAPNSIHFADGFQGLRLRNNWFGAKLDGQSSSINSAAVTIEGDRARIGGTSGATGSTPADRNVFASVRYGIRILGADDTTIEGNRFGRTPSGAPASPALSNVEVSRGADGHVPQRTMIGGEAAGSSLATPGCDGPCNLFAGGTRYIDLDPGVGTQGPAGETSVQGNFFGLAADGLSTDGGGNCVHAGRATPVTIGGAAAGERNRFGWCNGGVFAQGPGELTVLNNSFGLRPDGMLLDHTSSEAAVYLVGALADTLVADNEIAGMGSVGSGNMPTYGIYLGGSGATVVGNTVGVEAGVSAARFFRAAIYAQGDDNIIGTGDPDDANTIRNGTDAGVEIARGIDNVVVGNVVAANKGPGIKVGTAGGDVHGNYLGRNRGTANGGAFIDLVPTPGLGVDAEQGPNGAIEAPTLLGGRPDRVVGVAEPGAEVLVYRRANSANAGDADNLVGEATAGGDGRFTVSSLSSPGPGGLVAMQSLDVGSSELSEPLQPATATDSTAPSTTIVGGPGLFTNDAAPGFSLSSDEPASYICRLDGEAWSACPAQAAAHELEEGEHKFEALATDAAGNSDETPAVSSFTVDLTPPDTTIVSFPKPVLADTSAVVRLSATEPVPSYACLLDDESFACGATVTISRLAGRHVFKAAARDRAGNVDPTPATRDFDVLPRPPVTKPPRSQPIDIAALLGADLARVARRLKALRIRGLLRRKRGTAVTDMAAPGAGTLRLEGTAKTPSARAARRVRVLVGTERFPSAGLRSLTVRLTRAGKRLLRRSRRPVVLSLKLTFTDTQGSTTRTAAQLRLRR